MVKLVDTLASGASARKGVEVQVLSWAPSFLVQATGSADSRSSFGSKRGLFQLRARGACVIRLAAVRLEIPDHPVLGTILPSFLRSLGKIAKSALLPVRECGQLLYERLAPIGVGFGETLVPIAIHQYGFSCAAPPGIKFR